MRLRAILWVAAWTATVACSREPSQTTASSASAQPAPAAAWKATIPALAPPPKGLPPPPVPPGDPMTAEKVAIGRQLFFDKRLSPDGKTACASCHRPENGTGGGPRPEGPTKERHAPALWNTGYLKAWFWDGRAKRLDDAVRQELDRVTSSKRAEQTGRVLAIKGYAAQLQPAFGKDVAAEEAAVRGLSAFLRSLTCGDTAFDRSQAGAPGGMTLQQQKGWELFQGKAGCAGCHAPPFFSEAYGPEPRYHNTGVATVDQAPELMDPGRFSVTRADADRGAFRTPSLRNVAETAPYFHDGSLPTVDGAVIFDARGGIKNPWRPKTFVDRKLVPADIQSVIDFMSALSCDATISEPPLPPNP